MKSGSQSSALPGGFATLDGLRGLGALLVVVGHFGVFGGWLQFPSGPVVVDMFFMLSGFVIAFAYEERFNRGMSPGKFMLQRMTRLYPLFFLGILLGGVVHFLAVIDNPEKPIDMMLVQFVLQLFVLPAPVVGHVISIYPFNPPAWTLLFEFWVNLVYILAWPTLKNTRALIGVVIASFFLLCITSFFFGTLDVGGNWLNVAGGFARVTFGFFVGVLVFRLCGSPKAPSPRRGWLCFVPFVVFLAVIQLPAPAEWRPVINILVVALIGPFLLWAGQAIEPPRMFIPLFTFFGTISYAIYILHYPLFQAAQRIQWRIPTDMLHALPPLNPIIYVGVIAAAAIAERYFDRPVRAWIGQLIRTNKKVGAAGDSGRAGA